VGTVSPVRPLNLYGASDTGLALQSGTTGATTGDGFLLSLAATTNDVGLLNYENSDIFFRTAAVERMRIMNDGNVGIGTTSPGEKLDVRVSDNNYGLRITAPMSGNDVYNGIKFGYDGGTLTNDYYLGEIKAWKRSGGGGDLIFNSASSSSAFNSDQLVLAKNGNIGINTLAPTNLLSVTPAQYSTGTASQSTTAITGVGIAVCLRRWHECGDDYRVWFDNEFDGIGITDGLLTSVQNCLHGIAGGRHRTSGSGDE
jgi:hypothetical protein